MAIGITDPKARSLFRAEIQKLKIPENLPTYKPVCGRFFQFTIFWF